MPVLSTGAMTLVDLAKTLDPDGKPARVIDLLAQTNEMLLDMPFMEGNMTAGHQITVATGLPAVYWRLLNTGTPPSKDTTAQVTEGVGMLDAWSEVDVDLANLGGNPDAVRLSKARRFLEAMNQEMQSTLIYGNAGLAPEEFTGLAVRYSDTTAGNGGNIIDGGGASDHPDLTSIWLIAWGEETVFGITPKGSPHGLTHKNYGEETAETTAGIAGNRMRVYRDQFKWHAGLALPDWRYVVRIANLDVSSLAGTDVSALATVIDLISLMEHAESLIPNRLGRPVFYVNRTIKRWLRKQVRVAVGAGGGLTFENYAGRPTLMFGDIPIRTVDALLNTEEHVA